MSKKGFLYFKSIEADKIWRLWNFNPKSIHNNSVGNYSISSKLKRENKSNDEFEFRLNNLSLEEIIGLKLEIASRVIKGKFFGIPIYNSMLEVVKAAVVKYAFSCSFTRKEAITFLGVKPWTFKKLLHKYNIKNYFEK